MTDWLIELRFYVPLDTTQVISETFFLANLLAGYGKQQQNKSTHSSIKRNVQQYKINTKTKAKFSGLLRHLPWKRRGPILVLAPHKFVTYLLTYLDTYPLRILYRTLRCYINVVLLLLLTYSPGPTQGKSQCRRVHVQTNVWWLCHQSSATHRGDSDVISSYHIYASCFTAML